MQDVSHNPGYFTHAPPPTTGAPPPPGCRLLGGLITTADLQRGYINHALAISLVETGPALLGVARATHRRLRLHARAWRRSPKAPASAWIPS